MAAMVRARTSLYSNSANAVSWVKKNVSIGLRESIRSTSEAGSAIDSWNRFNTFSVLRVFLAKRSSFYRPAPPRRACQGNHHMQTGSILSTAAGFLRLSDIRLSADWDKATSLPAVTEPRGRLDKRV